MSAEELERIRVALATPAPRHLLLKIMVRSPRMIPEVAGSILTGVKQALQADNVLVWLLQSARVRLIVPDAATGVAWQEEDLFVQQLLPFLSPDVQACEIGCGGGRVSRHVAAEVRSLVACDVSRTMLSEAKANLGMFPDVRFVRTRGFGLDELPDDEFDLVFAHGVMGHLDPFPLLALLAAAHRVLRGGGRCVANFHVLEDEEGRQAALREALRSSHGHRLPAAERPYTEAQIKALFEAAGFADTVLSRARGVTAVASTIAIGTAAGRQLRSHERVSQRSTTDPE